MRVLLDCSSLVKGGAMQVALGLIYHAARAGVHEWHLALSAELAAQLQDVELKLFRSAISLPTAKSSWQRIRSIRSFLPAIERSVRPDVTFTVFGPPYWKAQARHLSGFALPMPLYPESVVWKNLRPLTRLKRKVSYLLRCWGLRWSDYLVVETETVRQRLSAVLNYPSERVFVVRNSYSPLFEAAHDRVARHPSCFSLFVPSSYYPHKNLESIPYTAAALQALTSQAFEFVLTLPVDDSPWQKILQSARRLGVESKLRSLGSVPHQEIARLYRRTDAVFLPTLLECSTAVYPESFCAEVPLCTSDLDFARELCADAALYFDPSSPPAAARALLQVMSDAGLRATLVERGRRVLRQNYPTPAEKWRGQLECLCRVAKGGLAG